MTVAYMPTKAVELRVEGRYDRSNVNAFTATNGSGKNSQSSVGVEAVYKF